MLNFHIIKNDEERISEDFYWELYNGNRLICESTPYLHKSSAIRSAQNFAQNLKVAYLIFDGDKTLV